ncbi:hypothetical protein [Methylobacterium iners]|jgi:hypothetical protein|uniref:Uncharacterized protein n=1 Tax=Methylobacterium iners TaxID=418707 RepID=A0ABQ4S307_9HYPH|nr:hypothetical protein [Methylobacterium iners]GJD96859.1 hypothetical protein OCOJLMKI_4085 [Methylobacterium iners]
MSALEPRHRQGDTIDKVDQVSSLVLLAFALVGAAGAIAAHALLG